MDDQMVIDLFRRVPRRAPTQAGYAGAGARDVIHGYSFRTAFVGSECHVDAVGVGTVFLFEIRC